MSMWSEASSADQGDVAAVEDDEFMERMTQARVEMPSWGNAFLSAKGAAD